MIQLLWIALAGALGALSRYGITYGARRLFGEQFPSGTLIANVLGCLILGFAATAAMEYVPRTLRLPLTVGFLGSLTTFSTFSFETVALLEKDAWGLAMTNVFANLLIGGAAVFAGMAAAKSLTHAAT